MNELDHEATLYDLKERCRKERTNEGLAQGLNEGAAKSKRAIAEKLKAMASDI